MQDLQQNKPVLQDSYDPIDESDLVNFEAQIESRLPDDYRSFLLERNGGCYPTEVANRFDLRDPAYTSIHKFHGLRTNDYNDLATVFQITSGDRPSRFIPIGNDLGGAEVCLNTNSTDFGSIWTFLGGEVSIQDSASWLCVATSIQAFIAELCYNSLAEANWHESIPLFRLAQRGDSAGLAEGLKHHDGLESRNAQGMTLLMRAACSRQSHIVQSLLEFGAVVDSRDRTGRTALGWAAYGPSLDSTKLLIEAGADVNAVDEAGNTPLLIAVERGYRVPKFLVEYGANVEVRNHLGESALDLCGNYRTYLEPILLRLGNRP